ncbi:Serine/threonine-protein kinase STY46 [Porphyridium purpureum]|uniref:Serine/threonine-protein kinase STY46 n=1 Tax=Porphyridium purpureum TaxID=35688 RepID=A0A5J4Z9I6_PORPP|nr:Serine/threonine-protein kinase STY46 [Porphyridium purpureum]|eukprot:POR1291..scf295_1
MATGVGGSANGGAPVQRAAAVMTVAGMAGTEWRFQLLKKLESRKDSAVSLMKAADSSATYVVKRQVVASEKELHDLLAEIGAWKKAAALGAAAMKQFGATPPILNLEDCVLLSKKTGSAKNGVMFIYEFCPNASLHEWMSRTQDRPTLDEGMVLRIVSQVVSALHFVHESGCSVHGNVSAQTVFVAKGPGPSVKLGGFGISRSHRLAAMADSAKASPATDVFLVGALLCHLAYGELPLELQQAVDAEFEGRVISESINLPKSGLMKNRIRAIAKKCLERKPKNRLSMSALKYEIMASSGILPLENENQLAPPLDFEAPSSLAKRRSAKESDVAKGRSGKTLAEIAAAEDAKALSPVPIEDSRRASKRSASQGSAPRASLQARNSKANLTPILVDGENPNSALDTAMTPAEVSDVRPSQHEDETKTKNGLLLGDFKRNKGMEQPVNKATEFDREAPSSRHVHLVILEIRERKSGSAELYKALYKRPMTKSPTIAFKSFNLIHRALLEGPPSFLEVSRSQKPFFDWIASVWSKDRVQTRAEKSPSSLARCFLSNEILDYASFIQAKIKFHSDYVDAFEPNWSRRVTRVDGTDPLLGKKRVIITQILSLMEANERFLNSLLSTKDECRACKVAAVPCFILDLSKAYAAVASLLETVEADERKQLLPEFAACHYAVRAGIEKTRSNKDAAELCREDLLVQLDSEPPNFDNATSHALVAGEPGVSPADLSALVERLEDMGFNKKDAKKALKKANGSLELALELLAPQKPTRRRSINTEDAPSSTTQRNDYKMAGVVDATAVEVEFMSRDPNRRPAKKSTGKEKKPSKKGKTETSSGSDSSSEQESSSSDEDTANVRKKVESSKEEKERPPADQNGKKLKNVGVVQHRRMSAPGPVATLSSSLKDSVQLDPKRGEARGGAANKASKAKSGKKQKDLIPPKEARKLVKNALKGYVDPDIEIDYDGLTMGMQLGQGGFGTVYKAFLDGKTVAVKKMHSNALRDRKQVEEFKREVAVLHALRHPNILYFYGACTRPPNLAIVTEFCEHGTLFDVLHKEQGPITWAMVLKFAIETCRGVLYLHECGLLHRDLKSSNLLMDAFLNVKVGDFGLTRLMTGDATMMQMTGQCGTFQYMAPEVLSSKPYSEKADVFSYGILLWEICARQLPYFGMQPMQVGMAVVNQHLRPTISPQIPRPFTEIMKRCWHQDQLRRPDLEDVHHALSMLRF